jgi:hypothetical protein
MEDDGYRLFEIAAWAGHVKGWLQFPPKPRPFAQRTGATLAATMKV